MSNQTPRSSQLIQKDIVLAPYTSWKVGGLAEYFALPTSVEELQDVLKWAKQNSIPVTVLGGGSNVLISDHGIKGLVLCLRRLSGVESEGLSSGNFDLTALAGTLKTQVMKSFLREGLSPALFLAGLPGDLGGGVVMNAGVSEAREPREFRELVKWIDVVSEDGSQVRRFTNDDIQWFYRRSAGWQPGVIVRVSLSWPYLPQTKMQSLVREAHRLRQKKQPLQQPSCGSTFKNPHQDSAGRLIEECGLKGFTIGGAQVSSKHANFIVNTGSATASDILELIVHVQAVVLAKTSISLQTEVVLLGF
jgi:UDP-N-acetylmuramate dehydrogenase